MKFKIVAVTIVILFVFISASAQYDYSQLKQTYRKEILSAMKRNKIVGASIAIVDGDSIVWNEAFGYADATKKQASDEKTQYCIGSITKLFTATAVMQLQEQNKLDIDQPVNRYLPRFAMKSRFGDISQIKVRQVLTHHAGLPCDIVAGFCSTNPAHYSTEIDLLNNEYAIYPPGFVLAYSNPGFSLLGNLVEEVSHEPYPQYIKSHILVPLNMNSSCFAEAEALNQSCAYDKKGKLKTELPLRQIAAGSLKSNTTDLARFIMAWIPEDGKSPILQNATIAEMWTQQNKDVALDMGSKIGLTWFIKDNSKIGKVYNHGGATLYHRSYLAIAPETKLGVVVLTNSENGGELNRIAIAILEKIAQDKGIAVNSQPVKNQRDKLERIHLTTEELAKYSGWYTMPGFVYRIDAKNGKLHTNIQGLKVNLLPQTGNNFKPQIVLLKAIPIQMRKVSTHFESIANEQIIVQSEAPDFARSIFGQKVELTPITNRWKTRLGIYTITNAKEGDLPFFNNFELLENDGVLILQFKVFDDKQPLQLGMQILTDNLAYGLGIGRQGGYALQVTEDADGNEVLRFSGLILKKKLK